MCFFHISNCRSLILHAFVFSSISTSSQDKDKEVKNERERVRIQKKNAALKVIKKLIMTSPLISEEAKKKRWTEVRNSPGGRDNYHTSTIGVHSSLMYSADCGIVDSYWKYLQLEYFVLCRHTATCESAEYIRPNRWGSLYLELHRMSLYLSLDLHTVC